MENYVKDFDGWNIKKKRIDKSVKIPNFGVREIWWCFKGVNVGTELDGKGVGYTRPILIIRKYGDNGFTGVPLSTQLKDSFWCINFEFRGINSCAIVNQSSYYDSKRLTTRYGLCPKDVFEEIKEKHALISQKIYPSCES